MNMSVQSQRGKVKASTRVRSQRQPGSQNNSGRGTSGQSFHKVSDENLGIFANFALTYVLGRHVIGNVAEVLTIDGEKILGVVKAISPSNDLGLSCAQIISKNQKSGRKNVAEKVVPWTDVKMIRIPDVPISDCLNSDIKTDSEIAKDCGAGSTITEDKELIPYFGSSDNVKVCLLDQGGFPANEMFETNEKLFSVSTTYNPDLREYTTPVDRTAPDFLETEARCAKLAQDIEQSQATLGYMDDEGDRAIEDEEEKFCAVSRPTAYPSRPSTRGMRINQTNASHLESSINAVTSQVAQISVQSVKNVSIESTRNSASGTFKSKASSQINGVSRVVTQTPETTDKQDSLEPMPQSLIPVASAITTEEVKSSISSCLVQPQTSSIEERVKKSTLDPNAPEFQPMGLSYIPNSISPQVQPVTSFGVSQGIHLPHNYVQSVNVVTQSNQMPTQAAFIAAGHTQLVPAFPFAHQSAQMSQLLANPATACVPGNISQHMRAGSLPPSLTQQGFIPSGVPGSTVLPQYAQSGVSLSQMINAPQPLVLTGHNTANRFPVCATSIGLTRQRSNESPAAPAHSTTYAMQQPSMSIPALQSSAIYQYPHPFLVSGHPQMGLHFLPAGLSTSMNSSGLMVGNVHVTQAMNQQLYPAHALMHMQPAHFQVPSAQSEQAPPPSTTPQQATQQQTFPQHYQEHSHIQIPSYGNVPAQYQHNFMLASQQAAASYYPAAPTMISGINPIAAGLLPLVGQSNHNTLNPTISHQPNQVDSSLVNSQQLQQPHQLPQPVFQPQLMQHYPTMSHPQLLQAQQLVAAQHMNNQHLPSNAYQAIAAAMASCAGGNSQTH